MSAGTVAPPKAEPQLSPPLLRLGNQVAIPVQPRALICAVILVLVAGACLVFALTAGEHGIALSQLGDALLGRLPRAQAFVVDRLVMPRVLVALGAGAALALAGSLFQTVTRNPLGTPEFIGVTSGAGLWACLGMLIPVIPTALSATAGAAVAVVVVWFAAGRTFAAPGKLIIAGIGVSAVAVALTSLILTRVNDQSAASLTFYLAGSLASRSMQDALFIGVVVAVGLPAVAIMSRRLTLVGLGDELATTLGTDVRRTRNWAIVVAIVLAVAAVNVVGPVAFISLTAPQIAWRLTRTAIPPVLATALLGGVLLAVSDQLVQLVPTPTPLPVGVVTAGLGSLYLGGLLLTEFRKGVL